MNKFFIASPFDLFFISIVSLKESKLKKGSETARWAV